MSAACQARAWAWKTLLSMGHADDRATTFEQELVACPEVVACHMVAGDADYLLEVTVADLDAFQHFLVGTF